MNDRDVFRTNLNHYLSISGKLQKDLAEYVGAKTTTVSGWTRGISYPRADAMEKIAMFFGVPTTHLVGQRPDQVIPSSDCQLTKDEMELITAFRAADERARSDALLTLLQHPAAEK